MERFASQFLRIWVIGVLILSVVALWDDRWDVATYLMGVAIYSQLVALDYDR